jgi:predicted RNA-binding Zn-ribbon protein involved in translation (DUF1610 family)
VVDIVAMSDRKYGQRGYQDQEKRERPRPSPPSGPRQVDPAKGPKGRGLGAPNEAAVKCGACGTRLPVELELAPASVCPSCGKDLHTCSNCASFEPSVFRECRLGGATLPDGQGGWVSGQKVMKKSTRNECSTFSAKTHVVFAREATREPEDPRSAFDALFKS